MTGPNKDMIRYEIRRQQLKRRRRLVGTLAGVVVVAAALALMVPALSMTRQAAVNDAGAVPTAVTFQAAELAGTDAGSNADEQGEGSASATSDASAGSAASASAGAADASSSSASADSADVQMPAQLFQGTLPDTRTGGAIAVRVEAPEGAFPIGTTMTLRETLDETIVDLAKRAAADGAALAGNTHVAAVDITFKDSFGNVVEPATEVRVQMGAQAGVPKEELAVVHIDDGLNAQLVPSTAVSAEDVSQAAEGAPKEDAAAEAAADESAEELAAAAASDGSAEAPVSATQAAEAAANSATEPDATAGTTTASATAAAASAAFPTTEVAFETSSFSVYALVYTVDFAYEANGHQYEFTIPGEGKVALSQLMEKLGIAYDISQVASVDFSNDEYVKVSKSGLFGLGSDWELQSIAPFSTRETLTITLQNGTQLFVDVTDGQGTPLAELVTDATLQIGGQTYGSGKKWEVYPDTDYQMTLTFTEVGDRQFATGGSTMVMDMPAGLTLPDGQTGAFDIPAGLAGNITGNKYEVKGGKLYITFGDDPTGILTHSSNAFFDLTLMARFAEGTTGVEFNGRVKRDVDTNIKSDVSISKSGSYNAQTGKMEYTVAITSQGHTKNISVEDAIGGSNLKYSGDAYVEVNGQKLDVSPSTEGNGFKLTIPELQNGQTAYVKYTADLAITPEMADRGYKLSQDDANKVKVTPEGGDPHEQSYVYPNEIRYSNITKASTATQTEGDNTLITWTITVNDPPKNSIAGATISDQIAWNSKEAMSYVGKEDGKVDLEVKVYNDAGELVRTDTTSVGVGETWQGSNQAKWAYTIPDGDAQPYKYVITYKTEVDKSKLDSNSNGIVSNEASSNRGGSAGGTGVVPGVGPNNPGEGGSPIVAGKSASKVTEEYIDWDIVVYIPPEADYTGGLTITDDLPWRYGDAGSGIDGAMIDTLDTSFGQQGVKVEGLNEGESFTPTLATTNDRYLRDQDGKSIERQVLTIKIPSLAKSTAGRTLTVTVRTLNSAYWLWAGTQNTGFTVHTNNATVAGVPVSASGQPMLSTIQKQGRESNKPGFVQASDGSVYYRYDIQVTNVHEGEDGNLPLVITDTFDSEYLEFVQVGLSGATNDYNYQDVFIRGGEYSYSNDNGANPHVPAFQVEGNKLTITAQADDFFKKEDGTYYPYYHIYYYLKLKDDKKAELTQQAIKNGGTYQLSNVAEWNGLSAQNDVDYTVPTVQKAGWFRDSTSGRANNRLFDFVIDVNPEGYALNGGKDMELTDSHTNNLTVDYATVRVYEVSEGVTFDQMKSLLQLTAKKAAGEQLQEWEQSAISALEGKYEQAQGIEWDFSGNQGKFWNLKDRTHYVIAYSALVIGTGNQGFSNEADMNGFTSSVSGTRNFGSTATAGADVFQIQLLKHEYGKASNGLAGATFQLFVDDGNGQPLPMYYGDTVYTRGNFSAYPAEYKEFEAFNAGRKNLVGQPVTFTTNESGYVLIALNQTIHGTQLDENVHYYLKEVESPAGYKIDSSVEYWSFTLTKDPDSVSYGGYDVNGNRQWIYFYYDDILKMSNTHIGEDEWLDVNASKVWLDESGQPMPDDDKARLTATVKLLRRVDGGQWEEVPNVTNKEGAVLAGTQTLSKANGWHFDWGELVRSDDKHTYAYKLEEVAVEGFVSSLKSDEKADEDDNTSLTFTATNQKVSQEYPTYTNLKVKKQWFKEDGETPETDGLPDNVQFQLFRVVSRTPFATAPTAGGTVYKEAAEAIGSAYVYDIESGTYQIPRDDFKDGIEFKNLVSAEQAGEGDSGYYFYSYYIKELEVEGYDQKLASEQADEDGVPTTTFTMTNTAKPTEKTIDLSVSKNWQFQNADGTMSDYSATSDDEVHFLLFQVSSSKPFADPTKVSEGGVRYDAVDEWGNDHWARIDTGTYQIGRNWNWTAREFKNLPAVSIAANGKATYYAYYVREVGLPENVQDSYQITANEDGSYKVTITNTVLPEQTKVNVSKKWTEGGNEIAWPDDTRVVVTLYRDGQAVQEETADGGLQDKTLVLTSEQTSASFDNLPKSDSNGKDYLYTVQERFQAKDASGNWADSTTVNGKAVKATITQAEGGYTITNDLQSPGSLEITKTLQNNQDLTVDAGKISFTVTGPSGYSQTFTYNEMEGAGATKSKILSGLNPGAYTVKETDANTGMSKTATYTVTPANASEPNATVTGTSSQAAVVASATTKVAFTNTYSETDDTGLTLRKVWKDASGQQVNPPLGASATFAIHQVIASEPRFSPFVFPKNSSDGVIVDAQEGDVIVISGTTAQYAGTNVILGGKYTYVSSGDGTTIREKFTLASDQIQGGKTTIRFDNANDFTGDITISSVEKRQEKGVVQTVTLPDNGDWQTVVAGLPSSGEDGNYKYWIEEISATPNTYKNVVYTNNAGDQENPVAPVGSEVEVVNQKSSSKTTDFTVLKSWTGADESLYMDKLVTFELFGIPKITSDNPLPITIGGNQYEASPGDTISLVYSAEVDSVDITTQNTLVGKLEHQPGNVTVNIQYLYYKNNDSSHSGQNYTLRLTPTWTYTELDNGKCRVDFTVRFPLDSSLIPGVDDITITKIEVSNGIGDSTQLATFTNETAGVKEIDWTKYAGQGQIEGLPQSEEANPQLLGTHTLSYADVVDGRHWGLKFEDLADGYIYYAVEKTVDGNSDLASYDPHYVYDETARSETITNSVNVSEPSTVEVTATKAWDDTYTNHPEVTFTLYRKALAEAAEASGEGEASSGAQPATAADARAAGYELVLENGISPVQTLAAVTGKTFEQMDPSEKKVTWIDLPEADDAGNKYDYLVIESPVRGYALSRALEPLNLNTFAFVNTPETLNLTVSKTWVRNGSSAEPPSTVEGISYKVMRTAYSDPNRSSAIGEAVDVTSSLTALDGQAAGQITKGGGWTQTLSGLPKFTISDQGEYVYYGYYVVEDPTGLQDYAVTYTVDGGQPTDAPERALVNMANAESGVTITNGTYSVSVNVVKTDSNTGATLTGATFQLKRSTGSNMWENVAVTRGDNGVYAVAGSAAGSGSSSGEGSAAGGASGDGASATTYDLESDANGKIALEGLTNGTYQFVETKSPDGYLIISDVPITFTVSNGTMRPTAASTARYEAADNTFIVPNTPGDALPVTGGSGNVPLYATGAALVLASLALLAARRRTLAGGQAAHAARPAQRPSVKQRAR